MSDYINDNKQIDYVFLKEIVTAGMGNTFGDPVPLNDDLMGAASMMGISDTGLDGKKHFNPYADKNMEYSMFANTPEQAATAQRYLDAEISMIGVLKNNPAIKDKPNIQQFYGFQEGVLNDVKSGKDVWTHLTRIPGGTRAFMNVDFLHVDKIKGVESGNAIDAYDTMFAEMEYPKVWAGLNERVEVERQMEGADLSPEQKAEYSKRIQKANSDMISVYEKWMSQEYVDKYSKFYNNYSDPMAGTVSGGRGVASVMRDLKEENELLAKGWDPTRLAEYRVMRNFSRDCSNADGFLEEMSKASTKNRLGPLKEKTKKMADLDPSGRHFDSQEDFDRYMADYSASMLDMMAEAGTIETKLEFEHGMEKFMRANDPKAPGIDRAEQTKRANAISDMERTLPYRLSQNNKNEIERAEFIQEKINPNIKSVRKNMKEAEAHINELSEYRREHMDTFAKETYDCQYTVVLGELVTAGVMNDLVKGIAPELQADVFKSAKAVDDMYMVGQSLDDEDLKAEFMKNPYDINEARAKICMGDEKTFDELTDHLGKYKAGLDAVLKDERINAYPGIKSYIKFYSDLSERALMGRDIQNELHMTPGGNWFAKNGVDFITVKDGKVNTLEDMDRMISAMDYGKHAENVINHMDAIHELSDLTIDADKKKEATEKLISSVKGIEECGKHLMEPETIKSISDMYVSAEVNVRGTRGVGGNLLRPAEMEQKALEAGWDPIFASDYYPIADIMDFCSQTDMAFKAMGEPAELSAMRDRANEVFRLDPRGKKFNSKEEFTKFYQDLSESISGLMEEADKPQIQEKLHSLDRRTKMENGKDLSSSVFGCLDNVDVAKKSVNARRPRFAYFAKHANLEARGITAEGLRDPEAMKEGIRKAEQAKFTAADNKFQDEIAAFEDSVDDIRMQAREKLEHFKSHLDGLRKNNSELYRNMKNALEKVADLPDGASLSEVKSSLDGLGKASKEYADERSGIFKSSAGKERLNAAADLMSFASNAGKQLDSATKETVVSQNPDKRMDDLDYDKERRAERAVSREINEAVEHAERQHAARGEREKNKVRYSMDELHSQFQSKANLEFNETATQYGSKANEFEHLAACMIAGTAREISEKRTGINVKYDPHSDAVRLESDPAFKKMMAGVSGNVEKQKQMAAMEPGEIYGKFLRVKKDLNMQAQQAKQRTPARANTAEMNRPQKIQQGPAKK